MRLHSTRITAGVTVIGLIGALAQPVARTTATLPNRPDSVKFAVIGDNGTGGREQYQVGQQMADARREFPYDLVLMLGDNFYGSQRPADLVKSSNSRTNRCSMRASGSRLPLAIMMSPPASTIRP